jgi:Ca2+-binding RTX toxin-like protein
MSFSPTPIDPVDITGLDVPAPSETVRGGTVLIVTSEPGRGETFEEAITLRSGAEGVIGAQNQTVEMRGNTFLTVGTENGTPLPIGGLAVDASLAKKVVIDLNGFNSRSEQVKGRLIPDDLRSKLDERPNTFTVLSEGDDSFIGSNGADLVVLNKGNNTVELGRGKDTVVVNERLRRSSVELGGGKDTVIVEEQGLRRSGRLTITDFKRNQDSIKLETNRSNVEGFGTDRLRISTRNGDTFRLRSDGDTFSRSSVEFI